MQLCLENDIGLSYKKTYYWDYIWNNSVNSMLSCPYYFLLGNDPDVIDFFSSTLAQNYFKKRLFYIEARWGYSSNLAIWELINETDALGYGYHNTTDPAQNEYLTTPAFQVAVTHWEQNMYDYLNTFYPKHPVTTGYAGGPGSSDNSPSFLDILENHDYNFAPQQEENYIRLSRPSDAFGTLVNSKPFLFGELGGYEGVDDYEDCSFHNSIWATSFIGAGTGLYFADWNQGGLYPQPHRNNFNAIATFLNPIAFEDNDFTGPEYYSSGGVNYYFQIDLHTGSEIGWFPIIQQFLLKIMIILRFPTYHLRLH